jgi:multiple antibiotic resistance protein
MPSGTGLAAFLLAFPALFSIVNPIGGALIFLEVTAARTLAERASLARRVGLYSTLIMLGALWGGSFILRFFGITLGALRIAGGIAVALNAWSLLSAPERHEERKQKQAEPAAASVEEIAFFPLTMPFTTGPGTIAVAITLGGERPHGAINALWYLGGVSLAVLTLAVVIWFAYNSAGYLMRLLGTNGARILMRMTAFLLLCIGIQIIISGVAEVLPTIAP